MEKALYAHTDSPFSLHVSHTTSTFTDDSLETMEHVPISDKIATQMQEL